MSDIVIDQEVSRVEEKLATPRIVKNGRTGQSYSVGIGLPKEQFIREANLAYPPSKPHFFQADNFQLVKEGVTERDETLIDRNNVNVLYMHGIFKDGQWMPEDKELQQKGITIEDIIRDHEVTGIPVDVLFVCARGNNLRVMVIPFQNKYERPKVYMKKELARGNVMLDNKTGEVRVQMRVKSENDVEFEGWKNWGRVKVI